jgi:peroxiredoxin
MSSSLRSALLCLAMALITCAVASAQQPSATTPSKPSTSASDSDKASGVPLNKFGGGQLRLDDYKGKPVVLNFWATWCTPCRTETPWFVELYKKYKADGLEVVGISMDEPDNPRVPKFIANAGIDYPIAFGNDDVAAAFDANTSLPVTVLIARDGHIAKTIHGIESKDALDKEIQKIMAK